jgi:hypothetical protein
MDVMDEHAQGFGQHRIMGCPYHGLVRGNRLTLPTGTHIDDTWFASTVRGSYRLAVPGVPAISRTPDEVAYDTAAGYQWRTDAVVNMQGDGPSLYVYGRGGVNAQAIYAVAPGQLWSVRLPFDMSANAGKTALLEPALVTRYGRLSFAPADDDVPVTVTLAGFDIGNPLSFPVGTPRLWDSLPDGSQVIIGETRFGGSNGLYQPDDGNGFNLLKVNGAGTTESPITVELEELSPFLAGTPVYTDDLDTFSGRWTIDFTTVDEFRPVGGEACEWLFRTIDNPQAILLPPGIESPETPVISIVTGTRSASMEGYVLSWWFNPAGEPVPVTLDMSYSITADYSFDISGDGVPAPEVSYPYILDGGACVLAPGAGGDDIPGAFAWSAAVEQTCTELVEVVLRVGTTEIDRWKVRAEFLYTLTYSDTVPAELLSSSLRPIPPMSGATTTHQREIYLNDVLLDSDTESGDSAVGIGDAAPVRILDPTNQAANSDVKTWLPSLAASWFQLDINPTEACSVLPHWWSNHLVCLKRRQRPVPGTGGISEVYGVTAHPEGVTTEEFVVPAPSSVTNAPPRFGARNPFTGDVLLGQIQPVTYI